MLGNTFHIYTDHKSLKNLLTQTIQTPKQQKWLTKLIGYNFEIHYKPGKENLVADALSRVLEASTGLCATVRSPIFPLSTHLQQFYAAHAAGKQLLTKLCESSTMQRNFSYRAGILYFQERIFIPREAAIIPSLLEEYHSSPLGGHSGIKATISRLSAVFYWPGMYADVKHFINSCSICHYNKYSTQPPYGLLQPLPVPQQVWEDISMDFVTNLHVSSNKTVIWVVVDRLTKYAHFIALPTHFTTSYLASMFLSEIHRLHGTLKTIVSDRDRIFISKFWKELFKSLGTTLAFSSSYHPQTDGQIEVLNRCLETYLRCFFSEEPQQWTRFLSLAEFWYNTSHHSAIGMTPFEALYGRAPPSLTSYVAGSSKIAAIDENFAKRSDILQLLKNNLHRAQHRMIQQVNSKRRDKEFAEGDWVYLKLQPYRQVSVHRRSSQKLAKRFYEPFCILHRIGPVAYELELPSTVRIHPVFHVSLLKPCIKTPDTQILPLPVTVVVAPSGTKPQAIIGRRTLPQEHDSREEVLVHWEGQMPAEATWESRAAIVRSFPDFDLKGKIYFGDMGNDTNRPEIEHEPISNSGPSIAANRPKRIVKHPAHHNYYV